MKNKPQNMFDQRDENERRLFLTGLIVSVIFHLGLVLIIIFSPGSDSVTLASPFSKSIKVKLVSSSNKKGNTGSGKQAAVNLPQTKKTSVKTESGNKKAVIIKKNPNSKKADSKKAVALGQKDKKILKSLKKRTYDKKKVEELKKKNTPETKKNQSDAKKDEKKDNRDKSVLDAIEQLKKNTPDKDVKQDALDQLKKAIEGQPENDNPRPDDTGDAGDDDNGDEDKITGSPLPGITGDSDGVYTTDLRLIYDQEIKHYIGRHWAFSEDLAGGNTDLETRVKITILPGGEISEIILIKSSGNSYLDESANRAIRKSNPLPPLPIGWKYYSPTIVFGPEGF